MTNTHSIAIGSTSIEINESMLFEQVESAIEGETNYWAYIDTGTYQKGHTNYFTAKFFDVSTNKEHTLSIQKLLNGLSVLAAKYPQHFSKILSDDPPSGDMLVQCALLGDIIYK